MYIYLHVPFCVSRCIYCDFYVVLEKYGGKDAYVDAVCREIDLRFAEIEPGQFLQGIQTLYIGGGTPSLLSASAYQRIFKTLNRYLPFAPDAEITLEANPAGFRDTKHSEMADTPQAYLDAGFNRVSVGVQSLNDLELKKLSRIHNADEAKSFIQKLKQAGWNNISLDLMYALPGQTLDSWQRTLQAAIALDVQHISMYGLKVEEDTPLARLSEHPAAQAIYAVPEDDENVSMYFEGLRQLEAAGFQRYEFSNLAKPGHKSRHNLNYWNNGPFLALGVAAHGYWNEQRYENVRDFESYLKNPLAGESRLCPKEEQLENAIIFGLRKAEGIEVSQLEQAFNINFRQQYRSVLDKYADTYIEWQGDRLILTEQAIPVSNAILAEFLK